MVTKHSNLMKSISLLFILSFFLLVLFYGCPSITPPKVEIPQAVPSKPEMTLQVATLNLAPNNKRIERKDIIRLAKLLKKEQVEILVVQNITRYPDLTTRTDFVTELSKQTDWRNVFGEMSNANGRQTGNAVFSFYPILSHRMQQFDGVKSALFESAVWATVDAGTRSVMMVSAVLPQKAQLEDQKKCVAILSSLNNGDPKQFMILGGNLPQEEAVCRAAGFQEETLSNQPTATRLWYSDHPQLKMLNTHIVETEFGTIIVAQAAIYH
jgi:endonuclease/exonuclease/phosphatase family metal-dependent hydrolase